MISYTEVNLNEARQKIISNLDAQLAKREHPLLAREEIERRDGRLSFIFMRFSTMNNTIGFFLLYTEASIHFAEIRKAHLNWHKFQAHMNSQGVWVVQSFHPEGKRSHRTKLENVSEAAFIEKAIQGLSPRKRAR